MTKIAVVCDNVLIRNSLFGLFKNQNEFHFTGSYFSCVGLPAIVRRTEAEVVLVCLDQDQSQHTLIELDKVKFIAISDLSRIDDAKNLLQHGYKGVIQKSALVKELMSLIERIRIGEKDVVVYNMADNEIVGDDPFESLATREREVLKLICQGFSVKEIAIELGIKDKTVFDTKSRAMQKCNIQNDFLLFRNAVKYRLVTV